MAGSHQKRASDAYYKSKSVIYYIIDQFLLKMMQLAVTALNAANKVMVVRTDAVRTLGFVLDKTYGQTIPLMFL